MTPAPTIQRITTHTRWPIVRDIIGIIALLAFYVGMSAVTGLVVGDPVTATLVSAGITGLVLLVYRHSVTLRRTPTRDPVTTKARHTNPDPATWLLIAASIPITWLTAGIIADTVRRLTDSPNYTSALSQINNANVLVALALVIITAPISEEILMRGSVYPLLRRHTGFLASGLISAILFGILHANAVQMMTGVLLGMLTAVVYEMTGRLYLPIIVHIAYNFTALIIPPGVTTAIAQSAWSVPATLLGLTTTAACIYALWVRTPAFAGKITEQLRSTHP